METETKVTVNEIAQRLAATHEELHATEAALAAIPEKKKTLLGGEAFDEKGLTKVETEEASLMRKAEYLRQRIPILEAQHEASSAREAQQRILELVAEFAELRAQYDTLKETFDHRAASLKEAAQQLVASYNRMQNAHDEQQFYLKRFEAFQLTAAPLTDPGAMPHEEDRACDVLKPIKDFWRAREAFGSSSDWGNQLTALLDTRHYKKQASSKVTIPGHLASVA